MPTIAECVYGKIKCKDGLHMDVPNGLPEVLPSPNEPKAPESSELERAIIFHHIRIKTYPRRQRWGQPSCNLGSTADGTELPMNADKTQRHRES